MRLSSLAIIVLSSTVLISCSDVKKEIGLGRNSPDEFAVVTRAPLSLPPQYDLTPPTSGKSEVTETSMENQAKALIFKTENPEQVTSSEMTSVAESALLQQAGADGVDPNIRLTVDRESGQVDIKDPYLGRRLMFWKEADDIEKGEAVDPAEELNRLKDIKANDTISVPAEEAVK